MKMHDYKVDYDNHPLFQKGTLSQTLVSPISISNIAYFFQDPKVASKDHPFVFSLPWIRSTSNFLPKKATDFATFVCGGLVQKTDIASSVNLVHRR